MTLFPAISVETTFTVNSLSKAKSLPETITLQFPLSSTVVVYSFPLIVMLTLSPETISPPEAVPVSVISLPDSVALRISSSVTASTVTVPLLIVVSTVILCVVVVLFPATSVAVIVNSCVPSLSSLVVIE